MCFFLSEQVLKAFEDEVKARGLESTILIKQVGCMGLCAAGPIVSVQPDHILYKEVTPEDAPAIMDSLGKEPIKDKIIPTDLPFSTVRKRTPLKIPGWSTRNGLKITLPKAATLLW